MTVLLRTLEGYNSFFKTHSNGFLSRSTGESVKSTLSTLHQSLDNSTLFLIDCKRAVRRDILFSHLSGEDVSALTRMVKGMRACLHGVGLAQILRKELDNANSSAFENLSEEQREIEKDTLEEAVQELQFLFQQISDSCYNAMSECIGRLSALQGPPNRTPLNSILWPFPRFFISSKCPAYEGTRTEPEELEDLVGKLDIRAGKSVENLLKLHHRIGATRTYGGLHLISMYRYNLKIYACKMAALLRFVKELELKRQKRRIWFPTNKAFRKWFRSREIDTNMGGDSGDYAQQGAELTLVRTNTRTDAGALDVENARSSESAFVKTPAGKLYYRDPDVDPPATAAQIFWDRLYSIRRWFAEVDTFFAFKTAAGTVLLALPIYLPESAAWYYEWRGQWALITLTLWMFPMTGMFLYSYVFFITLDSNNDAYLFIQSSPAFAWNGIRRRIRYRCLGNDSREPIRYRSCHVRRLCHLFLSYGCKTHSKSVVHHDRYYYLTGNKSRRKELKKRNDIANWMTRWLSMSITT